MKKVLSAHRIQQPIIQLYSDFFSLSRIPQAIKLSLTEKKIRIFRIRNWLLDPMSRIIGWNENSNIKPDIPFWISKYTEFVPGINFQIIIFGNSWIFGWNSKFMITLPLSDMLLQTLSIQNLVHLSAKSFGINGFSLSSGFLNLKMEEHEFRAFQNSKFIWNFEKYPTKSLQFGMQIKKWIHKIFDPIVYFL